MSATLPLISQACCILHVKAGKVKRIVSKKPPIPYPARLVIPYFQGHPIDAVKLQATPATYRPGFLAPLVHLPVQPTDDYLLLGRKNLLHDPSRVQRRQNRHQILDGRPSLSQNRSIGPMMAYPGYISPCLYLSGSLVPLGLICQILASYHLIVFCTENYLADISGCRVRDRRRFLYLLFCYRLLLRLVGFVANFLCQLRSCQVLSLFLLPDLVVRFHFF